MWRPELGLVFYVISVLLVGECNSIYDRHVNGCAALLRALPNDFCQVTDRDITGILVEPLTNFVSCERGVLFKLLREGGGGEELFLYLADPCLEDRASIELVNPLRVSITEFRYLGGGDTNGDRSCREFVDRRDFLEAGFRFMLMAQLMIRHTRNLLDGGGSRAHRPPQTSRPNLHASP